MQAQDRITGYYLNGVFEYDLVVHQIDIEGKQLSESKVISTVLNADKNQFKGFFDVHTLCQDWRKQTHFRYYQDSIYYINRCQKTLEGNSYELHKYDFNTEEVSIIKKYELEPCSIKGG